MATVVITEGESDQALVEFVLRKVAPEADVRVRSAGGRSSAVSLARSHLVSKQERLLLLLDADTTNAERLAEQKMILEDSLASVADRSKFDVILAQPELEAVLFADRQIVHRLTGREPSDEQMTRGKYQPKGALQEIAGSRPLITQRLARLQDADVRKIAEQPPLPELVNALKQPA